MTPRPYQKSRLARPGFSLVEMLVVIFIAGILIAITVGAIGAMNKMGAKSQTQAIISAFDAALDQTKDATGEYPRIAGSFQANATNITTAATCAEATWMNQALNCFSPNRLDNSKAGLDANNSLISLIKPTTDTYTAAIATTATFPEFRTASNLGVKTTGTQGTVSGTGMEFARLNQGGTLSHVRDAWDRYLVYFPSDGASADTAATLRPLIASPGPDGILESTPWNSSGAAYKRNNPATSTVDESSRVYYKGRWYQCIADHTSAVSNSPLLDTSKWQEYVADDIITRGDWR